MKPYDSSGSKLFIWVILTALFLSSPHAQSLQFGHTIIIYTLAVKRSGEGVIIPEYMALLYGVQPGVYLVDLRQGENPAERTLKAFSAKEFVGFSLPLPIFITGSLDGALEPLTDRLEFNEAITNAYQCVLRFAPQLRRCAIALCVTIIKESGGRVVIGGTSAGAVYAVGMYALATNSLFKADIAMTGTISPDGSIGAVKYIPSRVIAAARSGFKLVLVPSASHNTFDPRPLPISIDYVGHFNEAVDYFSGRRIPRDERVRNEIEGLLNKTPSNLEEAVKLVEESVKLAKDLSQNFPLIPNRDIVEKTLRFQKARLAIKEYYKAMQEKRYLEAIVDFSIAIEAAPDDPAVKKFFSEVDIKQLIEKVQSLWGQAVEGEDIEGAFKISAFARYLNLLDILKITPNHVDMLGRLKDFIGISRRYFAEKQYIAALDLLAKVFREIPDDRLLNRFLATPVKDFLASLHDIHSTLMKEDLPEDTLREMGSWLKKGIDREPLIAYRDELMGKTLAITEQIFQEAISSLKGRKPLDLRGIKRWLIFATSLDPSLIKRFDIPKKRGVITDVWEQIVKGQDVATAERFIALTDLWGFMGDEGSRSQLMEVIRNFWQQIANEGRIEIAHDTAMIGKMVGVVVGSQEEVQVLGKFKEMAIPLTNPQNCLEVARKLLVNERAAALANRLLLTRYDFMGGERTVERKAIEKAIVMVSGDKSNREKVIAEFLDELTPSIPLTIKKAHSTPRFADKLMAGIFVGTRIQTEGTYVWIALSGVFQSNPAVVETYAHSALRTRNEWAPLLILLLGEGFVSDRLIRDYNQSEAKTSDISEVARLAASFQREGRFNLAVQHWEGVAHKVSGAKRELSLCYALQGQWALAWYWMFCHLHDYPSDPIALSDLAVWFHQLNLTPSAERLLRQLTAPQNSHYHCPYLWGVIRYLQKLGVLPDLKVPARLVNHPLVMMGEGVDWLKWCQRIRPIAVCPAER